MSAGELRPMPEVGTVLWRVLWRRTKGGRVVADPTVEAVPCTVVAVQPPSSNGIVKHDGRIRFVDERGESSALVVHAPDEPAIAATSHAGARLYATPAAALHMAQIEAAERASRARRDLGVAERQVAALASARMRQRLDTAEAKGAAR